MIRKRALCATRVYSRVWRDEHDMDRRQLKATGRHCTHTGQQKVPTYIQVLLSDYVRKSL